MNWEKIEKMRPSSALTTCVATMLSDVFVGALGVKFPFKQAQTPANQYGPEVDFSDLGYGGIPKNYPGMQRGAVALLTAICTGFGFLAMGLFFVFCVATHCCRRVPGSSSSRRSCTFANQIDHGCTLYGYGI